MTECPAKDFTRPRVRLDFGSALCLRTLPFFYRLDAEAPVAANAKPRQFTFSEKPIDCASVNLQKIGQFLNG